MELASTAGRALEASFGPDWGRGWPSTPQAMRFGVGFVPCQPTPGFTEPWTLQPMPNTVRQHRLLPVPCVVQANSPSDWVPNLARSTWLKGTSSEI